MQQLPLDNVYALYYCLMMKAFFNASEVARLLKVDRATVARWIKKGLVKGAVRPGNTQQWRIPFSSYEELMKYQYESH